MILLLVPLTMLLLVAIAAPVEYACRRSPAFEARLARFIDRVL